MTDRPAEGAIHLRRLTALRAVAAVAVLLFHLDIRGGTTGPLQPVTRFGFLGVTFFFVLSGFVLTWSWRDSSPVSAFYLRRFARVYPSHLVMLVVALLVPVTIEPVTGTGVVTNLLLVQSWAPWAWSPFTANGVAWSLSCEAAFYGVLPLALWLLVRCGARLRWLLVGGYWAATVAAALAVRGVPALTWPPIRAGEFLLGVAAGLMMRGKRPSDSGLAALAAAAGTAAAALLVLELGPLGLDLPRSQPGTNVVATPLVLVAICWCARRDTDGVAGVLTSAPLVYAGRVSYALYLVHELVLLNVSDALGWSEATVTPVLLGSALLAAVVLHHLVERPCERWIRQQRLPGRRDTVARGDRLGG